MRARRRSCRRSPRIGHVSEVDGLSIIDRGRSGAIGRSAHRRSRRLSATPDNRRMQTRARRPGVRGAAAALVAAIVAVACSPTFDWREARPDGSGVALMFPCRPVDGRAKDPDRRHAGADPAPFLRRRRRDLLARCDRRHGSRRRHADARGVSRPDRGQSGRSGDRAGRVRASRRNAQPSKRRVSPSSASAPTGAVSSPRRPFSLRVSGCTRRRS